ncbi:DUF3037 domain-containing protein [Chitinophaga oryzae]|uniref:DUF3037 domain-containing protein n=1 Tax=Chitinophaga oryzae TaxID=2725414 RepID=A0AAE7D5S1_9BACT|nr:DUF3037 domain-containing protein [Chitinophaga oryzae]QJB30389.1 DUF3037 domain-containing protein [Chitinophaga oryzae]QJB36899.1 DUF3037 domain-containing protein [Chitinophaga oryzae]
MQDQHLYEYAVIRVVPRVEREEFLNAGVMLYCKKQQFLQMRYTLDEARLRALCPAIDISELAAYLCAIEKICNGGRQGGPIGMLDLASRFRWLTATRSTIVQTSRTHGGLCTDAAATLQRLYEQLVLL